jgi:hypothetical protein
MKKLLLAITLALACHAMAKPDYDGLFPADGTLYSTIISLGRETHSWLYQYANATSEGNYPGSILIAIPIW